MGRTMINEAQLFLAGYVAREPRNRTTTTGVSYTSLRVGYTPRRVDRETGEWSDAGTSFVTVFCWRALADNVATCVRKGDPVLVKGKLQVRPYTDKDGAARVAVEIEASSLGHDLSRGVANFRRAYKSAGETAAERPAAETQPDEPAAGNGALAGPAGPAAPRAGMFAEDAVAALAEAELAGERLEHDPAGPGPGTAEEEPAGVAAPF
jgi:single-strand DNA-binding protein